MKIKLNDEWHIRTDPLNVNLCQVITNKNGKRYDSIKGFCYTLEDALHLYFNLTTKLSETDSITKLLKYQQKVVKDIDNALMDFKTNVESIAQLDEKQLSIKGRKKKK